MRWAVESAAGPVYIRLVSVPWAVGFEPPEVEKLEPGRGLGPAEGERIAFVARGPDHGGGAWAAADLLAEDGVESRRRLMPWLRGIDGGWLARPRTMGRS